MPAVRMPASAGDCMSDTLSTLVAFGAGGQVGRSLTEIAPPPGWRLLSFGRTEVDVTNPDAVAAALAGVSQGVLINLSAYTYVDKAESEPAAAYAVNVDGARHIAKAAVQLDLPLIHLSTDFVFPGDLRRPLTEDDPTGPLSVYGSSKLAGEKAVLQVNPRTLILRTAWIFGPYGNNFVKTILRLSHTRPELSVVADQYGCPTPAPAIARTLWTLAERLTDSRDADDFGVFHYTGDEPVTWYDFAVAILAEAGRLGAETVPIRSIGTSDYPTPALRPPYSVLDCGKINRHFGIGAPSWRNALRPILQAIQEV